MFQVFDLDGDWEPAVLAKSAEIPQSDLSKREISKEVMSMML